MSHFCLRSIWRLSFKRLLSTLHNSIHITATGCSKVPWGLCVPLEESGIYTGRVCSEVSNWGQWRSRYAFHAGRHSNDKAFRSLLLLPLKIKVLTFIKEGECIFLYTSNIRILGRTISYSYEFWRIVSGDSRFLMTF